VLLTKGISALYPNTNLLSLNLSQLNEKNESLFGKNLIFNQFDFAIFGILIQVSNENLQKIDEIRNLISLCGEK
jgi:hypothetical protein